MAVQMEVRFWLLEYWFGNVMIVSVHGKLVRLTYGHNFVGQS